MKHCSGRHVGALLRLEFLNAGIPKRTPSSGAADTSPRDTPPPRGLLRDTFLTPETAGFRSRVHHMATYEMDDDDGPRPTRPERKILCVDFVEDRMRCRLVAVFVAFAMYLVVGAELIRTTRQQPVETAGTITARQRSQ